MIPGMPVGVKVENVLPRRLLFHTDLALLQCARPPARPPAPTWWEILSFQPLWGAASVSTAPRHSPCCLRLFFHESRPRAPFLTGVTAQCAYPPARSARWISPAAPETRCVHGPRPYLVCHLKSQYAVFFISPTPQCRREPSQ